MLNINKFIATHVIKRQNSMFEKDLLKHKFELSNEIKNKTVLVIGGAGSIGSSFIKSLLTYHPLSLTVVDINENGLTELTRDLRSDSEITMPEKYITYPMNYADSVFEKMFINTGGFDIVANFSAHKHVRSEKDQYSVEALIRNNVLNAAKLLNLLKSHPPEHFFCVSTDKAANPVNIMGASKKIMEELIMAYSHYFPVTTARFANVAFSNGSLLAGFLERISKQQTISAPFDVTRYFVSPEESGQICLMACILGKSGEIYFPKLEKKQMMTFSSIANTLLLEMGYEVVECKDEQEALMLSKKLKTGNRQYPVLFTSSDTSGEKAYEEFYTNNEEVILNHYNSLGYIKYSQNKDVKRIEEFLNSLIRIFDKKDFSKKEIVEAIQSFLPEFKHIEKEKSLDSKM